jgi:Tol biopolymer transport system component
MIGTTIGQYRIEAEAGAGGMGIVYRATDVDLKRPAAVKVLSAIATGDPERRRRFIQEAQAASALNHPDIVTIYQIGSEGTTDFIAMEFVAGRPLDRVIGGRALPIAEARRIALRIAGALGAAHRAGIVHRDLKPANVMLTDAGGVKLLDFGVAKLVDPAAQETALTQITRTGLVVGTLADMSPEQARGENVDARSDIYSFGVLLHEMLTGRRVDAEGTRLDGVPRDLARIVSRCVEREVDRRFQDIEDVRMAIEDADIGPAAAASARAPRLPVPLLLTCAALLAAGLAGVGWLAWRGQRSAPPRPVVLTRLTMDAGLTSDPMLSPDGRFIAFASDRAGEGSLDIWIRHVASGSAVRLTSDPADEREPAFSPDGSQIAFESDRNGGGLYVVSALGGEARRVADQCRRPRWSPKNDRLACWAGLNTGFLLGKSDAPHVFVVPVGSGEPQRLYADFAVAVAPLWSGDGTQLLFAGRRESGAGLDWWISDADGDGVHATGAYDVLKASGLTPVDGLFTPDAWSLQRDVLFTATTGDSTNVWRLHIDDRGRAAGAPQRVTSGAGIESHPTIASNGDVAFAMLQRNVDLWSLPADTATGKATGEPARLTDDPALDGYPAFSLDGSKLVFLSNRSGTFEVWMMDRAGHSVVLATQIEYPSLPVITRDGSAVFFMRASDRRWFVVPTEAGGRMGAPRQVCEGCSKIWDVTSDGQAVVSTDEQDHEITVHDQRTGKTTRLIATPDEDMGRLRLSPDDRWLTFTHRSAGSMRIQIVPFSRDTPIPRDRWVQASPENVTVVAPTWSPDGGLLYYLSDQDGKVCVWAVHVDRATGHPVGESFPVWHVHDARRGMTGLSLPTRSLAVSRDRVVIGLSESAGNVWLLKSS